MFMMMYVEVLVLTHEMATPQESLPYLSWAFRPAPVLTVFGRSAVLQPRCQKSHAVFWAWKDSPYFGQRRRSRMDVVCCSNEQPRSAVVCSCRGFRQG